MKLIDFEYRGEYSFFEYRYIQERSAKELFAPTSDTTLTKVVLTDSGEYRLLDVVPFPGQSCIVMITSPWKNTKWTLADGDYRARCYTKVVFDSPRDVLLTKYCNNPEEMFIIQGNWHNISTVKPRAFYKNWIPEETVTANINKPLPKYLESYSGKHSILNSDSDTTIVNCTDAGWWFQEQSYIPWYNPYVLSWRKAKLNVLSWRTPITAPFAFGFEQSPKSTAQEQLSLIKKHFPKTKKIIYFGQCLGSSKTISTAIEANADQLYTTSTFFDPRLHRSKNLLELTKYESVDALSTINEANKLPDTTFLYKEGDAEERSEYGRFVYNIGTKDNVKHYIVKYLDVWAPVLSNKPYGIFNVLNKNLPNTEIDLNFNEDPKLKKRIDTHG